MRFDLGEAIDRPLAEMLDDFGSLRAANLAHLEGWKLSPDDLRKRGTHPEFGPVNLEQLLATWTVRDLSHLAQIARVQTRQHRAEVGPWATYLPILGDPAVSSRHT